MKRNAMIVRNTVRLFPCCPYPTLEEWEYNVQGKISKRICDWQGREKWQLNICWEILTIFGDIISRQTLLLRHETLTCRPIVYLFLWTVMSCGRRNAKDKHPFLNKDYIYKHLILQNTIMYTFFPTKQKCSRSEENSSVCKDAPQQNVYGFIKEQLSC